MVPDILVDQPSLNVNSEVSWDHRDKPRELLQRFFKAFGASEHQALMENRLDKVLVAKQGIAKAFNCF